jgi:hypothetical protein
MEDATDVYTATFLAAKRLASFPDTHTKIRSS